MILGWCPQRVLAKARLHQFRKRLQLHTAAGNLKNFIGHAREVNNQGAYYMRSAEPALTLELN